MYEKNGVTFLNEAHYKRFIYLSSIRYSKFENDREYGACFYILSSSLAIFEKTKDCVTRDGIKTNSIIRKSYSTSEGYMVKISAALFNNISSYKLDFYWVVKLDAVQYAVISEAFRLRRK